MSEQPTTAASLGVPGDSVCLRVVATHEAVREVGPWTVAQVTTLNAGLLADRVGEIELAVHELCVNIVDHAFVADSADEHVFTICVSELSNGLAFFTIDDGQAVQELPPSPDPDHPQVGGYGLMILEQIASSVTYERIADTNRWQLAFTDTA